MRSGMFDRSITDLIADALSQVSTLVQAEVRLAKAELAEKAQQIQSAIGMFVFAAVVGIGAFVMFLFAVVQFLVLAGVPEHWASLIVAVAMAISAYGLVRLASERLKPENLTPSRTIRNLKRDAEVASEQV